MTQPPRTQDQLDERLEFMGLDQRARKTLRDLKPFLAEAIEPALAAFYEKVKATPETSRFFGDERHMATAKGRQAEHWSVIAAADYSTNYVNAVRSIGQTHARIGLEPRWYIGGYAVVIEQLIHALVKEQWPSVLRLTKGRPEDVAEALSVLVKAAMLDMDFAISVYLETLDDQRRRAEEAGLEAIEQERKFVANSVGDALAKLAAKDLTYRMSENMPESYAALQDNFNVAMDHLQEAIGSVAESATTIRGDAQEISIAAENLGHRTEQQAASLEETAAALHEIASTATSAAKGARDAEQIVTATTGNAERSREVLRQTVSAMNDIEKSSQQINQIIGVIDEMSFQTNLLALNAGVEAARAGEAGKGFAVVASEVRALARRSAEAAKEIKELVLASSAQIERGVGLVAGTRASLEEIVDQVTKIKAVVSGIAAGAEEQATGLNEVNTTIGQMDQVTQRNAAMVEESTAASRSLSEEADQLSDYVRQFQIANQPRRIGRTEDSKGSKSMALLQAEKAGAGRPALVAARKPAPASREDWGEF